ncbi:ABC transporter ATP-binding protein [Microbacterium sp. BWT-B31]|uniref:ABC transporter ATP-binding protein n=1 Tax=Microbacterium sp. BWT-B31 TaxID=3232072 RepID=UPI003529CFF1
MNSILELRRVAKSYGSLRVLDDVTFTVPAGQAVGIVGPNGAGKSTLLSVISGAERATAGEVRFQGRDVTRLPAEERTHLGMGRSFQVPLPFHHLTVFENALVGATYGAGLRRRAAEEKAFEALALSGLLPHANTRAGQLPLLDRKRLELARALATDPALLLLDEIAGGLTDPECESLVETIVRLRDSGVTIVWIEHVVHALMAVVARLLCLASGTLVADGEPESVMRSPAVLEVYMGTKA